MSSWVQLLLVVLAACLRFGAAEGDPLPAALVELVKSSPISSIEDLQLLLLSDSIDEEDGTSAANGGHRIPRSLNVQLAQQALCKVRTEVVEVTRAMLDRSNGNFMLWPPCVEVQRCSGCCNTKTLQCVAVVTHTRYLQVLKIEYIKRAVYSKAVVSVLDHVECQCQQIPAPKKKSTRRQQSHHHGNQTLGQVKLHSKDELHQWDELKKNQRSHLEDLLDQHWSSRGDTFPPAEGYSLPGEDPSQLEQANLFGPHWAHNSTGLQQTESPEEEQGKEGPNPDGNRTVSSDNGGVGLLVNSSERGVDEGDRGRDGGSQGPEENSELVTQNPQTQETHSKRAGSRFRPTKEPNPDPRGQARRRNNETPDLERILQVEEAKLDEESNELLLLHKRLDEEKETLRQEQMKREEKEADGRHHQHGKHHHHHPHHHQQETTTQKPETTASSTTTRKPAAPSGPRPPARPSHTRRRMRKNRKRISKAAMRAMLM